MMTLKEVVIMWMTTTAYRTSVPQMLFLLCTGSVSLGLALWLFGAQVERLGGVVLAVILILVLQQLLQPVFQLVAVRLGLIGIFIVGVCGSAIVALAVVYVLPGISLQRPLDALFVSWMYALGLTVAQWAVVSQSDDIMLAQILRRNPPPATVVTGQPGYVFIQLDGVSWPVLDWQLKAGNLPNISRLVNQDGYVFRSWKTQLPSTTPASQAGILLGSSEGIVGFRWYEKQSGRLLVANQPESAAEIERRLSNGKGLLADGGVSVGNLFSGDAPTSIMVMSKLGKDKVSVKAMSAYTGYFSSPLGFMRAAILSLGEMAKEIYQARRQVAQDVRPRIRRRGSYIALRAATNVLLRSLQTSIIIQNMTKGVNSLYADYLDYDEISHHAGLARPESLAALGGVDQVIGLLYKAKAYAPRPYHIVLLSDHGHSQGRPFRQLHHGQSLEDIVAAHIGASTLQANTDPVEASTASRFLAAFGTQAKQLGGALSRYVAKKGDHGAGTQVAEGKAKDHVVVTGSGSIGSIWLTGIDDRANYEQITRRYPALIPNLLATEGIGILLVRSARTGYMCLSAQGSLELETGKISGEDPLRQYTGSWHKELLRMTAMATAPDIAVLSTYNADTREVYAFEELVGNHGGIGGWQTEGILLYPGSLAVPEEFLNNGNIEHAETLHKIFAHWLRDNRSAQ